MFVDQILAVLVLASLFVLLGFVLASPASSEPAWQCQRCGTSAIFWTRRSPVESGRRALRRRNRGPSRHLRVRRLRCRANNCRLRSIGPKVCRSRRLRFPGRRPLPGLAWLEGTVGPRALRTVAALVAYVTMSILAYWLLRDISDGQPIFPRQPFVTDGVPALAFFAASRRFRRCGDDWVVVTLEAGAAATAALFIAIETRLLFGDQHLDATFGFDEAATFPIPLAWKKWRTSTVTQVKPAITA